MEPKSLGRSREIARQLQAFPVLDGVDPRAIQLIGRAGHWFCLPSGEELERTGAMARVLVFVLTGTMRVAVDNGRGGLETVALVPAGETVGEMSLLSDDPPSARLFAHRDTELFVLERKAFEHVAARRPALVRNLARLLAEQLRRTTQKAFVAPPAHSVALIAAHDGVPLDDLAYRLSGALRADGVRVICHDVADMGRPAEWYQAIEARHDLVINLAYPRDATWRRQAARKADRVILVEDGSGPPDATLLGGEIPAERIVLAPRLRRGGEGGGLRHLVRPNDPSDLARLARFLSGRAVGLVLSGGGARGFAHLGILTALRTAGVPIDAIGGASMGAIIGAGIAAEWPCDELRERMRHAFVLRNPMADLIVPTVSFFGGRRVRELLQRNFEERRIEELPLPFFCITSDLTGARDACHRSGGLAERLQASVALPGLLPPVMLDGAVHVDGGVMNNLPVDHMARLKPGVIVAIDVTGDTSLTPGEGAAAPGIVSILVRSGTVGNEWQRREARRSANVLFDPPLGEIGFRDWLAFDRAIALGHTHAEKRLAEAETGARIAADGVRRAHR